MTPEITIHLTRENVPGVSVWNETGHVEQWNCRTERDARRLAKALTTGTVEDGKYTGYPIRVIRI